MTDKIVQDLINKILRELASPAGSRRAAPEKRLKAQLDDVFDSEGQSPQAQTRRAARSQKRNIEEGYKRSTTSEYLDFIGFSQGSLEEDKGDIRELTEDGFLPSRPGSTLRDIGIDLSVFKGPIKGQAKGEPTEPGHPYYQPLSALKSTELTYEMFIELINKTDFLLRKLVESLERKLSTDQKYYQVERARIRDKFKKK